MDTTAAAELGGGVVDGGVGFWDTGPPELEGWAGAEKSGFDSGPPNVHGWGEGGSRARPSSGAYSVEPPSKRMRNMGGGDGYGTSGNFNSPGGFAQGGQPNGSGQRAGYGPPPGTPSGGESSGAGQGMSRGRGMGSIFYKTKLCSRFRNGNCPYSTNCNFAHGMDELRRPPPGWEDNSGPQEGGGAGSSGGGAGGGSGAGSAGAAPAAPGGSGNAAGGGGSVGVSTSDAGGGAGSAGVIPNQPQGQSPSIQGVSNDMQRFHKTRPCKKYFSELGCPYGDRCNFLHQEPNPQTPSKPARESVVVTVPTNAPGNGTASSAAPAPSPTQRPPNWKTRLCNKWETTGNCPFGDKCHFAHGTAELQRYGGGPIDPTSAEGSAGGNFADVDEGCSNYSEGFAQAGNLRQSSSLRNSRHGQGSGMASKFAAVWKGPTDGISTIYGDWVEEDEWETSGAQIAKDLQQLGQSTSSIAQRGTDLGNETYVRRDKEPQNTPLLRNSNGQNQGNAFLNASGSARGHGQSSQGFDLGHAEAGLGL